jgi:hypothetical protein
MVSEVFYREISEQLEAIPVRKLRETNPIFDSTDHSARSDQGVSPEVR